LAWIRSDQSLRDHPKLKRASRLLGIKPVHLGGHLHWLWYWALDYATEGDLGSYEEWEIAEAAGWDGDPSAFVDALVVAGLLERDGSSLLMRLYANGEATTDELDAARDAARDAAEEKAVVMMEVKP